MVILYVVPSDLQLVVWLFFKSWMANDWTIFWLSKQRWTNISFYSIKLFSRLQFRLCSVFYSWTLANFSNCGHLWNFLKKETVNCWMQSGQSPAPYVVNALEHINMGNALDEFIINIIWLSSFGFRCMVSIYGRERRSWMPSWDMVCLHLKVLRGPSGETTLFL